ncbi:hypothetical protein [Embleya sp. NPDC005575]|uniref:hypothetical protein n=1 Tax=Embleya sp. NPDC005575 TaxID=3156892 RepID=UPI0033BCD77C
MEWHLSLIAVHNPMLLYDADDWESDPGEDPHDGLHHATSLRGWLWTWGESGNIRDKALNP